MNQNFKQNEHKQMELNQTEQEFLIKRQFFYAITRITAWSIICSSLLAWGTLFLLRPTLVSPSQILSLLREKQIEPLQLAEIAVTGATAISVIFVLLIFIATMLFSSAKKEKMYLEIIEKLKG